MEQKSIAATFGMLGLNFTCWALITLVIFGRHHFTPIIFLGGSLFISAVGFALAKYTKSAIASFLGVIVSVYLLMIK
ncbi:MAG: hypothetical protein UU64_C0002G0096 [candidate division WWE3 bacterium GW2011_GWF2_41_45]|uniref:Uncharacterized protein n=1 Tax=candidate division WWE3 bacterium GW2011_GWC2_41_23 TaxID=1619123 RepID=A0A0G0Y285_UNCKA|nr:MAG: hypothetical protein UU55_C0001G0022 [candidate division WWE3 bacterium GW2011_GWC2_41_23]KKS10694.1 MAG: hypothetical protein UU64_C0002G0096 [candidate division WWE3 bacterium GW2011_GWF2_41_45]KKS12295.1 MAG: hypothetical protein UU68_C0002G0021 [candidate division WWE3 bacterium GW2011_GWF1_41_53]KKS20368.1 MAG: hypothetical protein UU79_C0001G0022 [candidate division WWE3 bacterium GW2011_GWE1_41_72]KKS61338.1 MAG: hypothetical protein UV27_C0002G0017 [candidate division WWE3 bacte